jgi:hypothetical protein
VSANDLRDAAATLARALPHLSRFALHLPGLEELPLAAAAKAVVEGAVLGRYHFHIRAEDDTVELAELSLVVDGGARPPPVVRSPGRGPSARRTPLPSGSPAP